jgi:hypothetical protein
MYPYVPVAPDRMLGFIVVRGTGILYIQPEELGKEEQQADRFSS